MHSHSPKDLGGPVLTAGDTVNICLVQFLSHTTKLSTLLHLLRNYILTRFEYAIFVVVRASQYFEHVKITRLLCLKSHKFVMY